MLVHVNNVPHVANRFDAMLVWMHEDPLRLEQGYLVKHVTRTVPADVSRVRYLVDVNTMHRRPARALELNEIGRVEVELHRPVAFDAYARNRQTGAFVVIDRMTNVTVGAGMILERDPNALVVDRPARTSPKSRAIRARTGGVSAAERAARLGHRPATVWLTGLPKSGKTTIAYALEKRLFELGCLAHVLDGENMRLAVSADLGFEANERSENLRRAAGIARLCNDAGLVTVCAFVSPYGADRDRARAAVEAGDGGAVFLEVHVAAPLEVCEQRDAEGLYARARRGELEHFSGVTAPYEPPARPDLALPTGELDPAACVDRIVKALRARGVVS